MAWEIREGNNFVVAPTELQAWIVFFGLQGKCFKAYHFFHLVRLYRQTGTAVVEIPS